MKLSIIILSLLSLTSVAKADFSIGYSTGWADWNTWNSLSFESETNTGSQLTNVFHFYDFTPYGGSPSYDSFSSSNSGPLSNSENGSSNTTVNRVADSVKVDTYGSGTVISSYTNSDGSGYNDVYRGVGQEAAFREEYYTDSSGQGVQKNIVSGVSTCYRYGSTDVISCD